MKWKAEKKKEIEATNLS